MTSSPEIADSIPQAGPANPDARKLGSFLGVYTPTILTILGVIMYLRFGWLVGHLGLERTVLIVIVANSITIITTLSFSAVATNVRVGVGGAYYIISRSLGLEIGGAVGLPLFLSQAFSVTLYAFGMAEALQFVAPDVPLQTSALLIVIVVSVLAFLGANLALKIQLPLMMLIGISLAALIIGAASGFTGSVFTTIPVSGEVSFWVGFAVFFPAVTGVMAGLGLSGDLRDPGKAIPVGSITAVITGFIIYLSVPFLLAMGASPEVLRTDPLAWTQIAVYGKWLVLPGLLGAIFSSAVSSMLTAPRTLQALARDRVAPRVLGRKTGDWRELLPGFLLTIVIALGGVLLGRLNAVAPVVSMFFLTVYGIINLVAAFEALSGDPSWRPKIRVPWPICLFGAFGCIFAMFLINPGAAAVAIVVEMAIWLVISRREREAQWGDARRGLYESVVRKALIKLADRPMSSRNWRPHLLVFAPDLEKSLDLVRFGFWFSQGRGLVTACQLLVGDLLNEKRDLRKMQQEMQRVLDQERLVVFSEVDVVPEIVDGIVSVSQANGMASIESNTVMVGWPEDADRMVEFFQVMRRLAHLNKSFILGRIRPRYLLRREGIPRTVHIWWGGLQRNGDLMLLLAYLMTRNHEWRDAHVQIMSIAMDETMKAHTEWDLAQLIPKTRIEAESYVFLKPQGQTVMDLIHEKSRNAEVVFFGLDVPGEGNEAEYAKRVMALAGDLPVVFFVKNSSLFMGDLLKVDGEDV
ncbi:MAG: Na-K-Cl cotransporter [Deltaproteobacteria bacterium]|nr:Na-K-Cl cotransporter [bacterium]MCB9476341.1 Na-K-Cl cotransporter [Deltaproteobacteria bacterium]MCB9478316.1 Na-K-Cl cotransporter [Deltaproteobacteria bacterium]MCB9489300.1 Na-K-Cl cotransporter [Deltaproteobacteria bacterium]